MKPKEGSGGYTFIEVMIVLAVSATMFATVVTTLFAQNRRNQFTESVNTFNQSLQDILNDVDTGYFPSNNDFTCVAAGNNAPSAGGGATEQGKNQGCVFAGKSLRAAPADPTRYEVQTLVGKRTVTDVSGAQRDVQNLTEARLTPLTWGSTVTASNGALSGGVQITKIRREGSSVNMDRLGVLTGFGQSAGAGTTSLKSGSIKSQLAVQNAGNWNPSPEGVIICLAEGGESGGGRRATIRIGTDFSQLASVVRIDNYEGC